jgi:hypothetical protein
MGRGDERLRYLVTFERRKAPMAYCAKTGTGFPQ